VTKRYTTTVILASLTTVTAWSAGPTERSPVAILRDHTLSKAGVNVATAYAMSNKIVTVGDRTYVSWLDAPSTIRLQVFDHDSGEPGPIVELGEGDDNHGGPALTVDPEGNLHAVFGPHHGPFQYRHTTKSGDINSWSPTIRFGKKCTYPSLICAPDGTLHLTCRGGNQPCQLHYYRRPANGNWAGPVILAHADVPTGYTQFGNSLTVAQNGILHLALHFYDMNPPAGKTVAYMRSSDGGNTWTDSKENPSPCPSRRKPLSWSKPGPNSTCASATLPATSKAGLTSSSHTWKPRHRTLCCGDMTVKPGRRPLFNPGCTRRSAPTARHPAERFPSPTTAASTSPCS
jgi:hypothetical protein